MTTDSESAVTLDETFVAGCNEKADEVDDSSADLGMFVAVDLIVGRGGSSWTTSGGEDRSFHQGQFAR